MIANKWKSSCCCSFKTSFMLSPNYVRLPVVCTSITPLRSVCQQWPFSSFDWTFSKEELIVLFTTCFNGLKTMHQSISSFAMIVISLVKQVSIQKLSCMTCKFNTLTTKLKRPMRKCNTRSILFFAGVIPFVCL